MLTNGGYVTACCFFLANDFGGLPLTASYFPFVEGAADGALEGARDVPVKLHVVRYFVSSLQDLKEVPYLTALCSSSCRSPNLLNFLLLAIMSHACCGVMLITYKL